MNQSIAKSLSPCEQFWEVHVPRILSVGRDTTIANLTCVAVFRIAGEGGGEWTVAACGGIVESVQRGGCDQPTATIDLTADVFLGIASGEVDHKEAFFRGEIQLAGDVPLILWIANLIPVLRSRFPFNPSHAGENR